VAAGEGSALLPMGLIVVAALLAAGGLGFLLRRGLR
jgi:ABC-type proline/glycine betaine transport system permease subunit